MKFLVENGADIEIANRHGHTALMIASYREKVEVVRYLLSVGAKINRTSVKGSIKYWKQFNCHFQATQCFMMLLRLAISKSLKC